MTTPPSTAFISRLSSELLCCIFITLVTSTSDYRNGIPIITGVCRRWRILAFGYGLLWSRISSETLTHELHFAYMQRLSRGPLFLTYIIDKPLKSYVFDKIVDFSARLTTLTITVGRFHQHHDIRNRLGFAVVQTHINSLLSQRMPVLSDLNIAWAFPEYRPVIDLLAIATPSLRELSLRNTRFSVPQLSPHPSMSTLRFLHFTDHPFDDDMHLNRLLIYLSIIPDLRALILDDATPHWDCKTLANLNPLSSLSRLFIRDRLCRAEPILTNMTAPNLKICSVWIRLGDMDPVFDTHKMISLLMNSPVVQARPIIGTQTDVTISFAHDDFVEFEMIRYRHDPQSRIEFDADTGNQSFSLTDLYNSEYDADQLLIDSGGTRFRICVYSNDVADEVDPNPNIAQAEMSMRPGIIAAIQSTTVRRLNLRGLTQGIGEYISGTKPQYVTIDGAGDTMPSWLWMATPSKEARFVDCVLTTETMQDIRESSQQKNFEVVLENCEEI